MSSHHVGIIVDSSVFTGCSAADAGVGVHVNQHNPAVIVYSSYFIDCSAQYGGGGMYCISLTFFSLFTTPPSKADLPKMGEGWLWLSTMIILRCGARPSQAVLQIVGEV